MKPDVVMRILFVRLEIIFLCAAAMFVVSPVAGAVSIDSLVTGGELAPASTPEPESVISSVPEDLNWAVGINYPGGSLKMLFAGKFAAEAKVQYLDKIGVYGARLYYYPGGFGRSGRLKLFMGLEADYLGFEGRVSKGSGVAAELFGGLEVFVARTLALQADMGPAFVSITDDSTSLSSSGLNFVLNTSLNYYF